MVKTNRNLWLYLLFSVITFGIYSIVWWCKFVKDVNVMCKDDGGHTMNFIGALLLGIVTFGIFIIIWAIKLLCRIYRNAEIKGAEVRGSIAFCIISYTVLSFTVVCPLLAFSKLCKTSNSLGEIYNSSL